MSIQLLIALATPLVIALALSLPAWSVIVVGVLPWAICDFIFRHFAPYLLQEGFIALSATQLALLIASIILGQPIKGWISSPSRFATSDWVSSVIMPSLVIAVILSIRGISVEFPSDTSVYYHVYFQENLTSCMASSGTSLTYQSSCNWYYSTQRYLWGFNGELSRAAAGRIAALNSFLLIAASCNLVWSATRVKALSWFSALILLLGFGNQNFHYFDQIGLNGTTTGIALLIATATPAQRIISEKILCPYRMIQASALSIFCGYFSYLAHGINAYFTINLLTATWIAFNAKKELSRIGLACIGLALSVLIALNKIPWNTEIQSALAYPEESRFVHVFESFWGPIYWYWPAMPSSTLEPSLVMAAIIGFAILFIYYGGNSLHKPASLIFCYLPFIVLAEWVLPFSSDLIFKVINPDLSYRIGWTSLYWILIPIGIYDLRIRFPSESLIRKLINPAILLFVGILSVPIKTNVSTNIFYAKTPHLLMTPQKAQAADGSTVLAIVPYLKDLCNKDPQLSQGRILSDPYVGFILQTHAKCLTPIASRDISSLTLESSERNQYSGLAESISSASKTREWLSKRDVVIVILVSSYSHYNSKVGESTRHWQPDLISAYMHLALNKLNGQLLSHSGFTLDRRIDNFSIYIKKHSATGVLGAHKI
jgi:hypothetical protein